jgi:alpha-L-fucosidase
MSTPRRARTGGDELVEVLGGLPGVGSGGNVASGNGGPHQQWQITDRGNGQYSIANSTTGLVQDGGGQVPSGSVTKQWTWVNSTNLKWTFQFLA